jgi:2-polyprenyl-3-methyl-5-hydroxy-6-metoxy-1,4-benzoquinol methylase
MGMGFEQVPIEAVKAYWDARPCNIRHSPRPVGEREYFDEVEARKYFVEPHIPRFAEFPRWRGRRVLEIGCGIGTDTINFARAGAEVTAVDLSEASLAIARRRAEVFGLRNIRFVQANVEELRSALPVGPYDLVYAFGVLHHTPRPAVALDELRHYVAHDGVLKIMVYHRRSWKVAAIVIRHGKGAFWNAERLVARYSEAQIGSPVTYTYTRSGVRRLLAETGFAVETMEVEHIFPWRIQDYVRYRYVKVWYFRVMPQRVFRWLERQVGWHLCVTARLAT